MENSKKNQVLKQSIEIQIQFLNKLEDLVDANTSLVFELSELLDISTDSVYRRLRGETLLSVDEIICLCAHYNISFDAFNRTESGLVTFQYQPMENTEESLLAYLNGLYRDLEKINKQTDSHIIYACEDIPVFYHYNFDDLANFKMFYWLRSIMNVNIVEGGKYDVTKINPEILTLAKNIYNFYAQVSSIEIWTETTIQSTLKQIEYYWEAGIFNSAEEAIAVCNSLKQELNFIQKQAETGTKDRLDDVNQQKHAAKYDLYFSEIEITNNCVLINIGNFQAVYLSHFSFYTMSTSNTAYCKKTNDWLQSMIKKTSLISGVSEKLRNQFFNKCYSSIDLLKHKIEKI